MEGLHVPLTAPFYADGRSYLRKLEHNVRRYSLTPASALVAFPPGGEADGLSDAEIDAALASIADAAAKEKVLVCGLVRSSVSSALDLAAKVEAAGFDAVLISLPTYASTLSDAERLVWFQSIADRSPLPAMLHSGPEGWPDALALCEVAALARHPNILGMYDAALTAERFSAVREATASVQREVTVTPIFAPVTRRMLRPVPTATTLVSIGGVSGSVAITEAPPAIRTRTRSVGFQVIAANGPEGAGAEGIVPLLESGVPGWMPALASPAPQGCHEVWAAFKDGDPALAALKASRLLEADALVRKLGIAGVKYGCDLNGYYGGYPRLPRLGLTADQREQLQRALAGIRN